MDSAFILTRAINTTALIIMAGVTRVTAIIVTRKNLGGTDGTVGTITTRIIATGTTTTGMTIDDSLVGLGATVARRSRYVNDRDWLLLVYRAFQGPISRTAWISRSGGG